MADARKKLILPLVIAPMKIPHEMEYSLAGLQTIDFAADADAADRQLLSALRSLRAIEEKSVGWVSFMDTKEGREKLNAILADPSLSMDEKIHDYMDVASTPSEGRKIWEKKMADLQSRRDAIQAEREELWKKQEKLMQEARATSSDEIKQLINEKYAAISRQLESLYSELTAISKDEFALLEEASRERDKIMDKSRKMLEESNKLIERIWR